MMNVNNIVSRRSEAMFLLIAAAVAVSLVSILAYLRWYPADVIARMAVEKGVVAAVCDPHEIANVLGVQGVDFMISRSRGGTFQFQLCSAFMCPVYSI